MGASIFVEGMMLSLMAKNLLRRKVRTLLTAAGIAIGVAMIVGLGAVAEGMRTGYAAMFSGSGADLVLMQGGAYDVTLSAVDEEIIAQVAALPEVSTATGIIVGNMTAPGLPQFYTFGYDPAGFAIRRFRIVQGQALGAERHEILMGKHSAETWKRGVGDTLRLTGGAFRVAGIYETGNSFEDSAVLMSLADAQQVLQKTRKVGAVQIKLKDARRTQRVRTQLERLYPRLTVSQSGDVASQQQIIGILQGMAVGIALLAVIIGGVGMTNTVMMGAFERTREIGTLRALGWGQWRVMALVLGESLLLGTVGGAIGCLLGAVLVGLVGQVPATAYVQGGLVPALFVQGMITAVALGGVGGFYPAWWASRLTPVEAMRYEGGAVSNARSLGPKLEIGDWGFDIGRTLWRQRTRTALTVLGISIGLAAVIVLSGLLDGLVDQFTEVFTAGGMDLIVMQANMTDMAFSRIDERAGRQIAALPEVRSVAGMITGVVTSEEIPYLLVRGYPPDQPIIEHFRITAGRGLSGNREIIVGRLAADALKVGVGDVLRLGEVAYRVVGLFEAGVSWEESTAVVSLRDAQTLYGRPRQVSFYAVQVNDPQRAAAIVRQIEAQWPELDATLSTELTERLPDVQDSRLMAAIVSALAIIVGGIGMMNTVIMSVFERTREIGTLRALGWRRRRVLAMVLLESLTISLIGAVLGAILAFGLGALMRQIPMFGGMLVVVLSPAVLGRALLVALALGTVGGLYPAWRAANLSPVEALRYE